MPLTSADREELEEEMLRVYLDNDWPFPADNYNALVKTAGAGVDLSKDIAYMLYLHRKAMRAVVKHLLGRYVVLKESDKWLVL